MLSEESDLFCMPKFLGRITMALGTRLLGFYPPALRVWTIYDLISLWPRITNTFTPFQSLHSNVMYSQSSQTLIIVSLILDHKARDI